MEDMKIRCAAIRYEGRIFIGDHHAAIGNYMVNNNICPAPFPSGDNQGFLTECGKYVRRAPGLMIAISAGQVDKERYKNKKRLYSEDYRWDDTQTPAVRLDDYVSQATMEIDDDDIEILRKRWNLNKHIRLRVREDGFLRRIQPPIPVADLSDETKEQIFLNGFKDKDDDSIDTRTEGDS